MEKNKHTIGPWRSEYPIVYSATGAKLVTVDEYDCATIHDTPLIAAAPDLLAALQAALVVIDDYLEYEHNGDPWTEDARAMREMQIDEYERDGRLEEARAVIAKATST